MGKTPENKRLKIAVHVSVADHPKLVEWRDKGHEIYVTNLDAYDVLLFPNAWRLLPGQLDKDTLAEAPLKAARAQKVRK